MKLRRSCFPKSLNALFITRHLAQGALVAGALVVVAPLLTAPATSKPQQLEIWPGQRVLLVLPLSISPTFNADPQLGQAILPLVSTQLQSALNATGKFAITLPYRFDPILRRAVGDGRVLNKDVEDFVAKPTLETGRVLFDKLRFDQPAMIADVKIEELRVGGTPKAPTLQIQASGRLYEQGGSAPFKSIVATSPAVRGGTASDRIARAATLVLTEIAQEFVTSPAAFELPLPTPVAMAPPKPTAMPTKPAPKPMPRPTPDFGMAPNITIPPSGVQVTPPNSLSPAPAQPFIPALPPAQPPLGLAVPDEAAGNR